MEYDRTGSGEPLVLLHGLGSRREVWAPVVPELAESYEVIAVDLPGFGASPAISPGGVAELTGAVAEFCARFGRPHLVGHSTGGGIALELGRRGLARSVTVFSPIGFWREPGRIWGTAALGGARRLGLAIRPLAPRIARHRTGRIAFGGLIFGHPGRLDAETFLLNVNGMLDAPGYGAVSASLKGYRFGEVAALADIPVTVAWGSRDRLLTYATQSRRARAALPGAVHRTLRGCGHAPFYDDPSACVDAIVSTTSRAA
jgi:pimeloyl-ACP methyl ester carboxylesterase